MYMYFEIAHKQNEIVFFFKLRKFTRVGLKCIRLKIKKTNSTVIFTQRAQIGLCKYCFSKYFSLLRYQRPQIWHFVPLNSL